MKWKRIDKEEPDLGIIHLLCDEDSVYIKGHEDNPFIFKVYGKNKPLSEVKFTHWTTLPRIPKN